MYNNISAYLSLKVLQKEEEEEEIWANSFLLLLSIYYNPAQGNHNFQSNQQPAVLQLASHGNITHQYHTTT